ncbi:right-handed parallel beta-helix repeat-containing protein [Xanthomonas sp. LF06-19]|uniref:right-handed parallel beta-helix repeat-containing protein n=2 Tax=Xanthomonas TaxID=338 RepID=UPI002A80E193|nr:right-handed parallel beta-helix repeat-containing protein [Xanthomonas sp. LF06-19]MDY4284572.1 right-handed parallel beta-helix repeat-containing protein [Xanthomonas sp. LF06-19]
MSCAFSRGLALLAALLPGAVCAYQAEPPPPERSVLTVDRYADDDAPGSLRWAITTANQAPGRYRIEIAAVGAPPYVIRPRAPLPALQGPLQVVGLARAHDGQYIAIDGAGYIHGKGTAACPGAEKGQFGTNVRSTTLPGLVLRDTHGVELSGLEIRNFCIGVLLNRASDNVLRDNRIVANHGGAGVMLTGDDGNGQSTATTTVRNRIERNTFLDNGDGLELTRGAAWNLVADNLFRSTDANPEPSQGIEILWGNDNTVLRNRFERYSDGLQINWGNRNTIADNDFAGNSIGVSVTGRDNLIEGNRLTGNGIGIAVRPQPRSEPNRFSANLLSGNGLKIERCFAGGACAPGQPRGAIVFGVPGLEHAPFVGSRGIGVDPDPRKRATICGATAADGCQPAPNFGQAAPQLRAIERGAGVPQVQGSFVGRPGHLYTVELFGNRRPGDDEAERYLGRVEAQVDAQGQGRFVLPLDGDGAALATLTVTVTSDDGATSPLSAPLAMAP